MRKENEIMDTLVSVAENDDRVRAVILNGSRVNNKIAKDNFQDFDIIYLVNNLDSFQKTPNWIDVFGERIITQMPNSMNIGDYEVLPENEEITYLMLFSDFNRIDLTLVKVENKDAYKDSLSKKLLDKDKLLNEMPEPSDKDYWVNQPTQKEFSDCCNEFWWVSTYVVKGLARNEIVYTKELIELPIRKMFMRMIYWNVAAENKFMINLGKSGRFLKDHVNEELMEQILKTYSDSNKVNIWNSLILMTTIFEEKSAELSKKLNLQYDIAEASQVKRYLKSMESLVIR